MAQEPELLEPMSLLGVRLFLTAGYHGTNPVYQLNAIRDVIKDFQQQIDERAGTANWKLTVDEVRISNPNERR